MARRQEHLSAYLCICVSAYQRICISAFLCFCATTKITKKQEIIIRHHLKTVTSIRK